MGVAWGFGAALSALMLLCVDPALAEAVAPDEPSLLLFAGSDLWRDGAFLHGGALWSPGGLDVDGFTLKLLLAGGGYTYPSGGLHTDVDGTLVSASVLPGWRGISDGIIVALYAGPIVQNYRLSPFDPGSLLHGFYSGAQIAGDVWYQPTPASMVAINGSVASIAAIGTMRAAVGWRFDQPFFLVLRRRHCGASTINNGGSARMSPAFALMVSNGQPVPDWQSNFLAAPAPICASASIHGSKALARSGHPRLSREALSSLRHVFILARHIASAGEKTRD